MAFKEGGRSGADIGFSDLERVNARGDYYCQDYLGQKGADNFKLPRGALVFIAAGGVFLSGCDGGAVEASSVNTTDVSVSAAAPANVEVSGRVVSTSESLVTLEEQVVARAATRLMLVFRNKQQQVVRMECQATLNYLEGENLNTIKMGTAGHCAVLDGSELIGVNIFQSDGRSMGVFQQDAKIDVRALRGFPPDLALISLTLAEPEKFPDRTRFTYVEPMFNALGLANKGGKMYTADFRVGDTPKVQMVPVVVYDDWRKLSYSPETKSFPGESGRGIYFFDDGEQLRQFAMSPGQPRGGDGCTTVVPFTDGDYGMLLSELRAGK